MTSVTSESLVSSLIILVSQSVSFGAIVIISFVAKGGSAVVVDWFFPVVLVLLFSDPEVSLFSSMASSFSDVVA